MRSKSLLIVTLQFCPKSTEIRYLAVHSWLVIHAEAARLMCSILHPVGLPSFVTPFCSRISTDGDEK